ncbi:hypothetical protein P8605_00530 [Streptomyces sp. T-3]|nr:hypothetical protein [Streptomyces sp. T-3]
MADPIRRSLRTRRASGPASLGPVIAHDRSWGRETSSDACWSVLVIAALLLLDWGTHGLTAARAGMWVGLGALLFVVLVPPRLAAGEGWLGVHGLLFARWVRTDCLVRVELSGGVAQRVLLRDAYGGRVQFDPRVLAANPELWHVLDQGVRRSRADGTLLSGAVALETLARRAEGETLRTILRISGLHQ